MHSRNIYCILNSRRKKKKLGILKKIEKLWGRGGGTITNSNLSLPHPLPPKGSRGYLVLMLSFDYGNIYKIEKLQSMPEEKCTHGDWFLGNISAVITCHKEISKQLP